MFRLLIIEAKNTLDSSSLSFTIAFSSAWIKRLWIKEYSEPSRRGVFMKTLIKKSHSRIPTNNNIYNKTLQFLLGPWFDFKFKEIYISTQRFWVRVIIKHIINITRFGFFFTCWILSWISPHLCTSLSGYFESWFFGIYSLDSGVASLDFHLALYLMYPVFYCWSANSYFLWPNRKELNKT